MINKYKYCVYFILASMATTISAQSMQDLRKMKEDYEKFQKTQTQGDASGSSSGVTVKEKFENVPRNVSIKSYNQTFNDDLNNEKYKNYYGYSFFTKRDTIPFWENLPTPTNYLLGSGDELIISIWGETQLRETYVISREGKIYDSKVGLLILSGKNISYARQYIKEQYGRVYSTLSGKNPSSYIDISLGKLKSINVNFVGELNYPGVYPIHPFSTVISGLIQAGGVDTTGSLRKVEIKRNGKLINTVDFYKYFISGSVPSDIQLKDQDVVVISPRTSHVLIDSSVVRPGIYESIPNETVYDLINYAGGPQYNADNLIGIRQINKNNTDGSLYKSFYVDYENTKNVLISSGDIIFMRELYKDVQEVEIIGQVKNPGKYHYSEGLSLKTLLNYGGGFNDSTFIKSIYKRKAEIIRRNPDNRYEVVIPINIIDVMKDNSDPILLNNLDKVVVHANLNFFEKENILIIGEVNIPGAYPLIKDNESLQSLINRAGGFTSKALENGISIYRNKNYFETKSNLVEEIKSNQKNNAPDIQSKIQQLELEKKINKIRVAWQNTKIALMPGDSIIVKEKTATIYVTGAVYNPGVLEYKAGKSLRSYINLAGGLTTLGNKKGIIVLYPNGMVSPKKWYYSPKVLEGSTIIINQKAPEVPFDVTQFATNWTSIISSMITAIVLSNQL